MGKIVKGHSTPKFLGFLLVCFALFRLNELSTKKYDRELKSSNLLESQNQPSTSSLVTTIPSVKNAFHINYELTDKPYEFQLCSPLSKPISSTGSLKHLIDFTPKVSSMNLNILYMGDSVGYQLYEWMTELIKQSSGGTFDLSGERDYNGYNLKYGSHKFASGNGGVVSFTRSDGLATTRNSNIMNAYVNEEAVKVLMSENKHYDVLVHRTPWPHMIHEIGIMDETYYTDILRSAYFKFGIQTVIFVTTPYNNNAHERVELMRKDNEVIRKFVKEYVAPPDGSGVRNVLLMDFEPYADMIMTINGKEMGIEPDMIYKTTVIRKRPQFTLYPAQAMLCAGDKTSPETSEMCLQGYSSLSFDGMHWCPEVGLRCSSIVLCLTSCIYDYNDFHSSLNIPKERQKECQDTCNDQFMSLKEIEYQNSSD